MALVRTGLLPRCGLQELDEPGDVVAVVLLAQLPCDLLNWRWTRLRPAATRVLGSRGCRCRDGLDLTAELGEPHELRGGVLTG